MNDRQLATSVMSFVVGLMALCSLGTMYVAHAHYKESQLREQQKAEDHRQLVERECRLMVPLKGKHYDECTVVQ